MTLNAVQVRVLGALIEKEIATPEAYPLSLNALVNACNQRSSRDPVMDLGEDAVREALHGLEELGLVTVSRDSRVPKFEHKARTVYNLRRDETAVLCLLMLRGPQTVGELRSRSDRLYAFDDLDAVESTLNRLASRSSAPEDHASPATEPLAVLLPRQPGSREARGMHLLAGAPTTAELAGAAAVARTQDDAGAQNVAARIAALEEEVASLRTAIANLQQRLEIVMQQSEHKARNGAAESAS